MRATFYLPIVLALLAACGQSSAPIGGKAGGVSSSGGSSSGSGSSSGNSTPPSAAEVPRDCFWAARSDPNAVNVLYPDKFATYWSATINIPPGGEVLLRGKQPHARYFSFNLYNPRLEPIDALADAEIAPNPGHTQGFVAGGFRKSEQRDYTVRIVAGVRPDDPAARSPNTLYSFQASGGQKVPSNGANILYRIYWEDIGFDITGGVGLPQVVVRDATGRETTGTDACNTMERLPAVPAADSLNTLNPPVETQPNTAGFKHLQWLKFFDLQSATANRFNATPAGQAFSQRFGNSSQNAGGFASNIHNNYVYATLSQSLGAVVGIKGRLPRTPATRNGPQFMPDGELRYASFCTNEANSTRHYDCINDEQIATRDGWFILAVSRLAERPSNARAECGVTWLEFGPSTQSLLLYRHMLPVAESQFPQAIQYIPGPPGAHEVERMGEHYPFGQHFSLAEFEALGCPVSLASIPNKAASND